MAEPTCPDSASAVELEDFLRGHPRDARVHASGSRDDGIPVQTLTQAVLAGERVIEAGAPGWELVAGRRPGRGRALAADPPLPPLPTSEPGPTPMLLLYPGMLADRLGSVRGSHHCRTSSFAYSVKTNPDPAMIHAALALGMDMEVITHAEWQAVVALGADPHRTIANGPGKWWPRPTAVTCRALFIDTLSEFDTIRSLLHDEVPFEVDVLGIRLRTAADSRFGIDAADPEALARAACELRDLTQRLDASWGVHVHHAQSSIGTDAWVERTLGALRGTAGLPDLLGGPPAIVDLGGGWHARDLPGHPAAVAEVAAGGPDYLDDPMVEWVFELGKSLVEPLGVVLTRVLVPDDGRGHVVIDATWGDLFEARFQAHRVLVLRDGRWTPIAPGRGTLYGRSCMEHDALALHVSPAGLVPGDLLAFADAGAYDVSLSFEFATGRARTRGTP